MPKISQGVVQGLKTVALPAALSMIIADSDSPSILGNIWDKAKVGGTVLGTGAAIGGAVAAHENYVTDKMNRQRLQAAQRAVLAQNNLLTTQDHKGDTVLVLPKDMSSSPLDMISAIPKGVQEAATEISKSHPVVGGAVSGAGAIGTRMAVNAAAGLERKAEQAISQFMPQLINSGTNPATRNFSEMESYYIGMDPSVSENMTGSLADFMIQQYSNGDDPQLGLERLQDFLGLYYPIAKTLESEEKNFSAGDFGILGTVMKGLTHGVSGLKKLRQFLPGKKGASAATAEVMKKGAENASNLGSSFANNIREAVKGETGTVAESVNKIANKVDTAGKTVSAFFKTGADNPDVANKMVRSFQKGATVAGVASGAKLASESRKQQQQQGNVAPPVTNQ